MNYGELRSHFQDVLNRSDCSDQQADTFISMGIRRTERLLRTPLQKTTYEVTVDGTWPGYLAVPADFLSISYLQVNGVSVPRITAGQPDGGYLIENARFYFKPDVTEGDVIKIIYYNEFAQGVGDAAITTYSAVIPDVIVYAALVFACDTFVDERKMTFEGTLGQIVQEVQAFADLDEMSGGLAMAPQGEGLI